MAKTKRQKALWRHRRREARRGGKRAMEARQERVQEYVHNRPMQSREEVREVVRSARARHLDMQAGPALDEPMLGEEAGRAIAIGAADADEAQRLWETFKGVDASHETYHRRIIGKPRFPNVAKMEYLPETFETRDDDRPDLRAPDEKDADAKRRWSAWCETMGALPRPFNDAMFCALWRRVRLHDGRNLTGHGERFVQAMRSVHTMQREGR